MGNVWSAVGDHGMEVLASGDDKKISNLIIEIVYDEQNFPSCRFFIMLNFASNSWQVLVTLKAF